MKIIPFYEKTNSPIVLCLGGFDSLHIGHKMLIEKANLLKKAYSAKSALFTFSNDFSTFLGKKNGQVFTFKERVFILQKSNIDEVYFAELNDEFASISPLNFLNQLVDNRAIRALICGKDFKFGKDAKGDVGLLKTFCKEKNIHLEVCDFATNNFGQKVSTTLVKESLLSGNIKMANHLLGDKYFIMGEVVMGRQVGRTLGFPTANIMIDQNKMPIKSGVYSAEVKIEGKLYKAIVNVGNAPTFNENNYLIECHIKDFNGDLYGQELIVYFCDYIRPIIKFEGIEQLIEQLNKDLTVIK